MYRITVTYTAGTVPTRVIDVDTKAQAENVVNAINDAILVTGSPTGGIAARWYDLTWYLGSVENAVTIKTERVAKTKVA